MKAIFIAAGMGSRLRPYTDDCPKCMLPLNGKPVIANNVDRLLENGVTEVNVVVGYRKEKIQIDATERFENSDYPNNNILFSLMCASPVFERAIAAETDLVISYSDIIYSGEIVSKLLACRDDIAISVDLDWRTQYKGRTEHPTSEAEKIEINERDEAVRLGKVVPDETSLRVGEFIGLLKLTPTGARRWLCHFEALRERLGPNEKFQHAEVFRKAYLTDFMQDLVDHEIPVSCSTFSGGWMEFDTAQDYEKLIETYSQEEV